MIDQGRVSIRTLPAGLYVVGAVLSAAAGYVGMNISGELDRLVAV